MNREELKKTIQQIEIDAENKKRKAYKEYAFSNNKYKIGDKITDHSGSIIITTIDYGISLKNFAECIYTGYVLKKDGTRKKNNELRQVWQSNIKEGK